MEGVVGRNETRFLLFSAPRSRRKSDRFDGRRIRRELAFKFLLEFFSIYPLYTPRSESIVLGTFSSRLRGGSVDLFIDRQNRGKKLDLLSNRAAFISDHPKFLELTRLFESTQGKKKERERERNESRRKKRLERRRFRVWSRSYCCENIVPVHKERGTESKRKRV